MPTSTWEPTDTVPLPLGVVIPRHTVHSTPLVRVALDSITIHAHSGEGEWPTIITGEKDGTTVGMAFEFGAQWHDRATDEVAIYTDTTAWWAIIEYTSQSDAERHIKTHQPAATIEHLSSEYTDTSLDAFREYLDSGVTPLIPTPDADSDAVYSIQRRESYSELADMFGLAEYEALPTRQARLHKLTTPAAEWAAENDLNRIARDLDPED